MLKKYTGSCHCGAVRFTIMSDISQSAVCDCSLCRRRGSVMVRCHYEHLSILQGQDALTVYSFNTMIAKHYFCKVCGVYTFHKMRKLPDLYAVNAGCLEDVNLFALQPEFIQGSLK